MTHALFAPCIVNQDTPHARGGGGKKLRAIPPFRLGVAPKPQPRFMDERGRLQRLAGRLAGHFRGSQLAELVVHQWKYQFGGLGIAVFGALEQQSEITGDVLGPGCVAHAARK